MYEQVAQRDDQIIAPESINSAEKTNNVQNEISTLQELIESDDLELPDTPAGDLVSNVGTSFITLGRTGDETLAQADYDTSEQENNLIFTDKTQALTISLSPGSDLIDANESVSTSKDSPVSGKLLTNAASTGGTAIVTEFTVNNTVFTLADVGDAGTSATLEQGLLTITPDGSYTFIPANNFSGVVPPVTYTVSDGPNTEISTLTITVTPVSDLSDDNESVNTNEDTPVSGELLTNATCADGIPIVTKFTVNNTVFAVANLGDTGTSATLEQGLLTIKSDGSYTFIPANNFNGTVPPVTYTISDGPNTDVSTLTITVTPDSDLTDDNESVTTNEDTQVSGELLTNANSSDGIPVVTEFMVNNTVFTVAGGVGDAGTSATLEQGLLTIKSDGSYIFVPNNNFNGAVPPVTYTVFDGLNTDTSSLTITVTPASDLTDDDESVSTQEDSPVSGELLTNATSSDGTPIIVTEFTVNNTVFTVADGDDAGTSATLEQGLLTINSDGSYTFVPANNFNGVVPPVTYTVSDGLNTDPSSLTITVTPTPVPPSPSPPPVPIPSPDLTDGNESVNTNEDVPVSGELLANVTSTDGTPIVTEFTVNNIVYTLPDEGSTDTGGDLPQGKLTIHSSGNYTFVPSDNFNGVVPDVIYTVYDGLNTDTSTLTITVTPVSDLSDDDELVNTNEDTPVSNELLTNATSTDGTPIIVIEFTVNNIVYTLPDGGSTDTGGDLPQGKLTIHSSGNYTFVPSDNFNGVVPDVIYTVYDGLNTDTSTLTITVTPVNNKPIATDDDFTVNQGETVTGNVISHDDGDGDGIKDSDSDSDNNLLTITQVNGTDLVFDPSDGYAEVSIQDGLLEINAQGDFTYINPGFILGDNPPSFEYTLSDGDETDNATVTINVIDYAPLAIEDNNYVFLQEAADGKAVAGSIQGNIIANTDVTSAGDRADTPAAGDTGVILTQMSFAGLSYDLVANAFVEISTDYGLFTIESSGKYLFTPKNDMDMPANAVVLVFDYEIKDEDTNSAETSGAELKIVISPPGTTGPLTSITDGPLVDIYTDEFNDEIDTLAYIDNNNSGNELESSIFLIKEHSDNIDKHLLLSAKNNDENEKMPFAIDQKDIDIHSLDTRLEAPLEARVTDGALIDIYVSEPNEKINIPAQLEDNINENTVDLGDFLIPEHSNNLDKYLSFSGEDEQENIADSLPLNLEGQEGQDKQNNSPLTGEGIREISGETIEGKYVPEAADHDTKHATITTVSNALFTDGATIISDTLLMTTPPVDDFHSTEFL